MSFQLSNQIEDFKIGDVGPAGGFIFFVDYSNQFPEFNYLEAAPTDAAASISWCDDISISLNWDVRYAQSLGRGCAYTNLMLATYTSGAAYAAQDYISPNNSNDWFLPSFAELTLMYKNLKQADIGGFANALYWSSSEFDRNGALVLDQLRGTECGFKKSTLRVRAVRAF